MTRSTLTLSCPSDLAQRLHELAELLGEPVSHVATRAISEYLSKTDREKEVTARLEQVDEIAGQLLKLRHGPGSKS